MSWPNITLESAFGKKENFVHRLLCGENDVWRWRQSSGSNRYPHTKKKEKIDSKPPTTKGKARLD